MEVQNTVIIIGVTLVALIIIIRLIGAWLMRIDEVIYYQKNISDQIHELHKDLCKGMNIEFDEVKTKAKKKGIFFQD